MMYKAFNWSVLLYGSDSWVVTGEMLNFLEGFHQWAARRITGMTAARGEAGEWGYSTVVEALEAAGLHPILEYIRRKQSTIEEKVAFHPIYELCVKAYQRPGTNRRIIW